MPAIIRNGVFYNSPSIDTSVYALKTEIPNIDTSVFALKTDIPNIDTSVFALKTDLPDALSDLTNDQGFITNTVNNLTNYYTTSQTYTQAEVNALISAIPKFKVEVVNSLLIAEPKTDVIYLLATGSETNNLYTEYIYVYDEATSTGNFEKLGTQSLNLSGYYTSTQVDNLLATKTDLSVVTSDSENDSTSAKAYAVGEYLIRNGVFYRVKAAIAIGDSFSVGTNIVVMTLSDLIEEIRFTEISYTDWQQLSAAQQESGYWLVTDVPEDNDIVSVANVNAAGIVKPDGNTITIEPDGTIHGAVATPVATRMLAGKVKPDGETISIDNDGTIHVIGISSLDDVSGVSISTIQKQAYITWTDSTNASLWHGTKVVVKAGSAPENENDGILVVDETIRNTYASSPYTYTLPSYDTVYYFRFFPYDKLGNATVSVSSSVTATRTIISAVPSQSGTLTYNGSEQTPSWSGYDTSKMTIGGTITGTNAGSYNATFTPGEDYMWSDESRTAKTVAWTIGSQKLSIPTVSGSFTYDGTEKSATIESYNTSLVSVSGNMGTNAGTYTVTFSLLDTTNTTWSDDSITDKTGTWTIGKADGGCTLTPSSVTLNSSNLSVTSTISNATGEITGVTSNDTTVATASVSGTTITVSSVGSTGGETTVTVSIAASTNYNAATATLNVVADFLIVGSWAGSTDAQIVSMIAAADRNEIDLTEYWSVGNERVVHINTISTVQSGLDYVAPVQEEDNVFILVAMDTKVEDNTNPCYKYPYVNPISGGRSYPSFITQQKYIWRKETKITRTQDQTLGSKGWNVTPLRDLCNGLYRSALPSSLVDIFKQVTLTQAISSGELQTSDGDYLFLPTEKEIFGTRTYSPSTESDIYPQWPYYATQSNRIKTYTHNLSDQRSWWLRSTEYNSPGYWCLVSNAGVINDPRPWGNCGIAPCGCI